MQVAEGASLPRWGQLARTPRQQPMSAACVCVCVCVCVCARVCVRMNKAHLKAHKAEHAMLSGEKNS